MYNVLVDNGSSLNVLPNSTLSKLSYQGAPMRFSGVVVKAFDGSSKTVIGEVDLPIKISMCLFHITFQVMDIHAAYICLLGRPWIHEVGAVTSTLHQKLKFVKNGKLVIMGREQAMLVSFLSSFSYIDADKTEGTSFQALSVDITVKKKGESMSSLKDAHSMVEIGQSAKWGHIVELAENKNKVGLGFSPGAIQRDLNRIQEVFHSVGFIHTKDRSATTILEDDEEQQVPDFVTRGSVCQNWISVDVPSIIHLSK